MSEQPIHAPDIGQTLAGCRLIAVVGEGGMGTVYRARHEKSGRDVAVKVLHADGLDLVDHYIRFKREAELNSVLNHPHLVRYFGRGRENSRSFLVFELIEGEPLSRFLSRGQEFSLDISIGILIALSDVLGYLHKENVVHRDLKPGNVMITDAGVVKLADLGLAKAPHHQTLTGGKDLVGTLSYMSPEYVRTGHVGKGGDLYALGLIAYRILSGALPYSGKTPYDWVSQIESVDPKPLSRVRKEIPRRLSNLVKKILSKDPQDRPDAAGILSELRIIAYSRKQARDKSAQGTSSLMRSSSMRQIDGESQGVVKRGRSPKHYPVLQPQAVAEDQEAEGAKLLAQMVKRLRGWIS